MCWPSLPTNWPGPLRRLAQREHGIWHNLSFGLRAYLATPRLRGLLALSLAVASAGAMVIVNTVVYVRDRLGGGESDTAFGFAAAGAGSMAVALILPRLLDKRPERPASRASTGVAGAGVDTSVPQSRIDERVQDIDDQVQGQGSRPHGLRRSRARNKAGGTPSRRWPRTARRRPATARGRATGRACRVRRRAGFPRTADRGPGAGG